MSVKIICVYCGVGCGVLVDVGFNGVVIKGDFDYLVNYGWFCFKGLVFGEIFGIEGCFFVLQIGDCSVGWDEVFDLVVDKFFVVIVEYGLNFVVFYVLGQLLIEDYYVINKFVKGFVGMVNIDMNLWLCMVLIVVGYK